MLEEGSGLMLVAGHLVVDGLGRQSAARWGGGGKGSGIAENSGEMRDGGGEMSDARGTGGELELMSLHKS